MQKCVSCLLRETGASIMCLHRTIELFGGPMVELITIRVGAFSDCRVIILEFISLKPTPLRNGIIIIQLSGIEYMWSSNSSQITSSGVVLGTVTPRSRTFPHFALLVEESTPRYVLVQLAWPLMGAYGHIGLPLPARCHPSPEYKPNVDIGPAGSSCDAHCHSHLQ
jgi:hypothetical protein